MWRKRLTLELSFQGAKVVATGSMLTNYTFVAHHGLIRVQERNFAIVFIIPSTALGVNFLFRTCEMTSTVMGNPYDDALSSRFDENAALFIIYIVERPVASGLIYLNSHSRDFQNEEIRPYID